MHKNETRPGYKKTKVGWIPREWEQTTLGKICDLQSGKFIAASAISEERQRDSFPCFGGNGLRGYVDSYSHHGNYPLIGRQGALCGNVCWASGKFYATEHAVVATPKDNTAAKWLYYKLDHLNLNKYATGVAQPGLSVQVLNQVITPAPPLPEQEAIAEVLECWDKGIRTLENKIVKKRLIKKGLMQRLLSGKIRLPGFGAECRIVNGECRIPKDWKTVRLGKVFEFITTYAFSRENLTTEEIENCAIYNIHYGDIHATYTGAILDLGKERRVPMLKTSDELPKKLELLQEGDLAMADASEDYEGVGACIELKNLGARKVTGGLHTFILRDISKHTADGFRGYMFKEYNLAKELKRIATGVSVYSISKTNLAKVSLHLPPLEEQQAIFIIPPPAACRILTRRRRRRFPLCWSW